MCVWFGSAGKFILLFWERIEWHSRVHRDILKVKNGLVERERERERERVVCVRARARVCVCATPFANLLLVTHSVPRLNPTECESPPHR